MYQSITFDAHNRVSWDANNADLPDIDNSAVALATYYVLLSENMFNLQARSSAVFSHFRREDGSFFCYPHELHPSPTGNLHALMALEIGYHELGPVFNSVEPNSAMRDALLADLRVGDRSLESFFHDKWHASWTYAVQRWLSVESAICAHSARIETIIEVVLNKQHDDGGWGNVRSTLEETAYVIAGLVRWQGFGYGGRLNEG